MYQCPFNSSCSEKTKSYLVNEKDEPFSFDCHYSPAEYFWGKSSSRILYIGVNPSHGNIGGKKHLYPVECLRNKPGENPYFGTIRKWHPLLYDDIGKENGVAFTDLVKCASPTFPFKKMMIKDFDAIFRNCRTHLNYQIREMAKQNLKFVIVSGIHPCWHILDLYFEEEINSDKKIDCISRIAEIEGKLITFIFFRKFMGRKDVSNQYRNNASNLLATSII